jgi:hypothetical protein
MTPAERAACMAALEALQEIALAGMSGTGQESEEGMRDWHARQAWRFIGIAARALDPIRAALAQPTKPLSVRQMIEGAWCAGYYNAGYTNDSGYADEQATKCADELLAESDSSGCTACAMCGQPVEQPTQPQVGYVNPAPYAEPSFNPSQCVTVTIGGSTQPQDEPVAFDWPDAAVLAVLRRDCHAAYSVSDVLDMRRLLRIADDVRDQFATAPQRVAQPLTPLTEDEISGGWECGEFQPQMMLAFDLFNEGVKFAEAAHGIGEQP